MAEINKCIAQYTRSAKGQGACEGCPVMTLQYLGGPSHVLDPGNEKGHRARDCPNKSEGKGSGTAAEETTTLGALSYKGKGKDSGQKGYGQPSSPTKEKGKGKGFQGKCWNCHNIGHIVAECKGKSECGKMGKGAFHLDGQGLNWASWDDYADACGSESQCSGYTAHVASPIWTTSLRQPKRLTPYKEAVVIGTEDEDSKATKGRYDLLRSEGGDDDNDDMLDLQGSSSEDEARIAPPPMPRTTQRQRCDQRRIPTQLTGMPQCYGTCNHADCAMTSDIEKDEHTIASINRDLDATDEEYTNKRKSRPNQRQRRRSWESRMQEEASREPSEKLENATDGRAIHKGIVNSKVSDSEALSQKTELMLDLIMGASYPLRGASAESEGRARERALKQPNGGKMTRSTRLCHPGTVCPRWSRRGKSHWT